MTASASVKDNNGEGSWKAGVSGFSGGAVSTMLLIPLDNIKVRLQVNEGFDSNTVSTTAATSNTTGNMNKDPYQRHARLGAIRMLRGVVKYEGVRGLYQGLVPAVVGSAVSWGGFFYVYETMKRELRYVKSRSDYGRKNATIRTSDQHGQSKEGKLRQDLTALNSSDNFILGTASGTVMVFLTNPIWLIKLRLQLQMRQASEHIHAQNVTQYDGFLDAFRKIVKTDGVLGLYKVGDSISIVIVFFRILLINLYCAVALSLCFLHHYKGTGPALILTSHGGVQFMVYEFLKKHFHYARAQRNAGSSLVKRFEDSIGYLTIGAMSKM
jgi:solute carrier family 25 folate transporter 32